MKKQNMWYFFLLVKNSETKKRGGREKKDPFKQNDVSSIGFFCPLPRIFCNGDFKLKILLRAKENLSITFFLFPCSLVYIETVINSKGLYRTCMMLHPQCECDLGPERELGWEE